MSIPTTREQFKQFCLRRLGKPVIEINVDDDQIEDRIDYSLSYYADYHFDATEKMYYKHQITQNNFPSSIYSLTLDTPGNGYSNSDTVVITPVGGGNGASASITTDNDGIIQYVTLANNGLHYQMTPTVTVSSNTGTGASITAELGGFIQLPENIIGAVSIFDLSSSIVSQDMFSLQYQIALNDIWSLSSYSMIPYYTTIMHLNLIQQLLIGQQPIRYTRHRNKLYIDMNWNRVEVGRYIIVEAYQVIDPTEYTDVWKDKWLQRYCTAQIKQQWGNNMKKFGNMALPGGIVFNGQQVYDEATSELEELEKEVINSYSIPNQFFVG